MSRNNKHIINVFGTLPRLHLNFCLHEGRGPVVPFTHLNNQQERKCDGEKLPDLFEGNCYRKPIYIFACQKQSGFSILLCNSI